MIKTGGMPYGFRLCEKGTFGRTRRGDVAQPAWQNGLISYEIRKFQISVIGISDFVLRISDFGFRISDFVLRISAFVFRLSYFGFRISAFVFRLSLYLWLSQLRARSSRAMLAV
jgi:hypothetical protein